MGRRLAAILAADVAGYSRLMEADEERTHAALRSCRSVIDRIVANHGGRIFGSAGDSVMVEFASPIEALRAALQIQQNLANQPLDLPGEGEMQFRIGLNVGDVMEDHGEIFGDGVNIAARLQAIAPPGGICLSGGVHQYVEGKLKVGFDDLGPCEVKNIAKPVHVYRVSSDAPGRAVGKARQASAWKPSVAVLPFVDLGGASDERLSDSITEDIIAELSRSRSVFIAARTSTAAYKGRATSVRLIGAELGADFVIEGSVKRLGSTVRVIVQLIDVETGNHVWSERYDGSADDVSSQDKFIQAIAVGILPTMIEEAVEDRAQRKPEGGLSAYEHLMIGERLMWDEVSADKDGAALRHLQKAVELDATCSRAFAAMGILYSYRHIAMGSALMENANAAIANIERALRRGSDDSTVHAYAAATYLWCGQLDLAERHVEAAMALNPNDRKVIFWSASVLSFLGNPEMGVALYKRAEDPFVSEGFFMAVFEALYMLKRYSEAIAVSKRIRDWDVGFSAQVAACCAQAGDGEQTRFAVDKFKRLRPEHFDMAVFARITGARCRNPEDRAHWLEGFRKAGFNV